MRRKFPILNFYLEKSRRKPQTKEEIRFWMSVPPRLKLELWACYSKFLEKHYLKKKKKPA